MKNDGLLTGILIGGIFGVAVVLLAVNTAKGAASNAVAGQESNEDQKGLNTESQNKDKQTTDNETEAKADNSAAKEKTDNKDDSESKRDKESNIETGKEEADQKSKNSSKEVEDKKGDKEEEVRNPTDERKKKTEKEGTAMGEDIASKLNFGKKISQLEESLKKLREENTQEN